MNLLESNHNYSKFYPSVLSKRISFFFLAALCCLFVEEALQVAGLLSIWKSSESATGTSAENEVASLKGTKDQSPFDWKLPFFPDKTDAGSIVELIPRFLPNCNQVELLHSCMERCQNITNTLLSSSEINALTKKAMAELLKCFKGCKKAWIDKTPPGCLKEDGTLVPGGKPPVAYTDTSTSTATSTGTTAALTKESDNSSTLEPETASTGNDDSEKQGDNPWLLLRSWFASKVTSSHGLAEGFSNRSIASAWEFIQKNAESATSKIWAELPEKSAVWSELEKTVAPFIAYLKEFPDAAQEPSFWEYFKSRINNYKQ